MRRHHWGWCALGALLTCALATTVEADDRITLVGGDVLHGRIIATDDQTVTLEHISLGQVTLDRARIVVIERSEAEPPPDAVPPPDVPDLEVEPPVIDEPAWLWRLEGGITGSEGRTETLNIRTGIEGRRETDVSRLILDSLYIINRADGERSAHRFEAGARHDWIAPDRPWFVFAQGRLQWDEFAFYETRLSAAAGLGYAFVDTDETQLLGRIGFGLSRDWGSPDNSLRPEALVALELAHQLSDTARLRAFGEYYPDLSELGDYRAVLGAEIETAIDRARGLNLKFGVRQELEERSAFETEHLLEYFATFVLEF